MVRYNIRFAILASLHIVFFCERTGRNELSIDGPHFRRERQGGPILGAPVTTEELMAFWVRALEVSGFFVFHGRAEFRLSRRITSKRIPGILCPRRQMSKSALYRQLGLLTVTPVQVGLQRGSAS